MRKVLVCALVLFIYCSSDVQAQKIGCINSVRLLQSLPEKVDADSIFARYARARQDTVEHLMNQFQQLGMRFQASDGQIDGSVSLLRLQQLQERIEYIQAGTSKSLDSVRMTLYQPITDKLYKVVAYLARKEKYDFVVDNSVSQYGYYGTENKDLTDKIKLVMKYGMKEVE